MDDIQNFEALRRQQEIQWETPAAIFGEFQRPEFPLEALPQLFQDYALAIAEQLQLYPDMPALELLAAVSTACAGKVDIEPYPGWQEPIQTYTMVVMDVGERKSPAFKLASDPLRAWQAEKARSMAGDIAVSQSKKRLLQNKLSKAENKENEEEAEACARELAEFKEITPPRIIVDDITPEKLASIMVANCETTSIWSSEGGIFSTLAGRYANKDAGPNIDLILKAYSSDMVAVDRIGRPTENMKSPALTIMLAVQPNVLEQLMSNQAFLDRGLCGRFVFSLPASKVGHRKIHSTPIPEGLKAEYSRIIRCLLDIAYPEEKAVLYLDQEAMILFDQWGEEIEPKLVEEWKSIGGWANKLQGLTLRFAGQIHMAIHQSWKTKIEARTMEKAIKLARYAVAHALVAFRSTSADKDMSNARKILEVIRKKQLIDFTQHELVRSIRAIKAKEMEQSLAILEDAGYICKDMLDRQSDVAKGRPTSPHWIVNPAITKGRC